MSHNVACRCGWEGDVADAGGHERKRCPACNAPLLTASAIPEILPVDATAASAPSTAPSPASAPPAVMHDRAPSDGTKAAVLASVWRVVRPVFGFVFSALRFYVERRAAILAGWKVWINEHMPSFDRPDAIRREIRISLDEQDGVHEEDGVWHIELPVRCVVCGGKASGGWIAEPKSVLDPYGPIVGPLAGVIIGVYLSWWNGSLLWLLLSIFVGVLLGYATRKNVQFLLRFMRCTKHAEPGRIPEVIVLHHHLVVRVGSRDVKIAFLQRGRETSRVDDFALPSELIVAPPHEMIAMADDVHPDAAIVPDHTIRLPTAEDENAPRPPAGPDEYGLSH